MAKKAAKVKPKAKAASRSKRKNGRKFTPSQIHRIRTRWATNISCNKIAAEQKSPVSGETIYNIVKGRTYKDVPNKDGTPYVAMSEAERKGE